MYTLRRSPVADSQPLTSVVVSAGNPFLICNAKSTNDLLVPRFAALTFHESSEQASIGNTIVFHDAAVTLTDEVVDSWLGAVRKGGKARI
jgi:hypothetical protein